MRSALVVGRAAGRGEELVHAFRRQGVDARWCPPWPASVEGGASLVLVHDEDAVDLTPPWPCELLVVCCRLTPTTVRTALAAGAAGVIDAWWTPDEIAVRALEVRTGSVAVPRALLLRMVDPERPRLDLSAAERAWLTRLANGEPMASIAVACRVSERELYRQLRRLYDRLGVAGREAAVALAALAGEIEVASRVARPS